MRKLLTFALLIFFGPILPAQVGTGLRATVNRWPQAGGASSRSRVSLTKVPVEGLATVWEAESEGRFLGETLVWDDKSIVLERRKDGDYQVAQIELSDGRISSRSKKFDATSEPEMAIWGRRAVVLVPGTGIQGFGLTRSLFTSKWRVSLSGDLGSPIMLKDRVLLRHEGAIAKYRWGQPKPEWSVGTAYRGDFAIADGQLFAVRVSGITATLDIIDVENGKILGSTTIGEMASATPKYKAAVQVSSERVMATVPEDFKHTVGSRANSMLFKRQRSGNSSLLHTITILTPIEPAIMRSDTILVRAMSERLRDEAWMQYEGDGVLIMAPKANRPHLFNSTQGSLQTRGTCWLGETAFDFRSGRIYRQSGDSNYCCPIPIQGGLLLRSPSHDKIRALRADSPAVVGSADDFEIPDGSIVTLDGQVIQGRISAKPAENRMSRFDSKDRETKISFDSVLVAEDAQGELKYWLSQESALRGVRFLRDSEQAELALECAKRAKSAKSIFLLDLYINEATALGTDEKELVSLQKALEGFEKKAPKINDKRVEELEKYRAEEEARLLARDWNRVVTIPDSKHEMKIAFLQDFLAEQSRYEPAQDLVRSWLPKEVQPKGTFKPGDWLDFILATKRRPIRIVQAPKKGEEGKADALEKEVGAAEHTWRKGLIGVASDQLLILTPMSNPSQIANCLTVGELVSGELERIFGGSRGSRFPLRIHLFPTKKDYVDFHAKRGMGAMSFSLGNYSPGENISRLYMPDDEDEFNDVLSTFVHELTHHWMSVRCPLVTSAQASKSFRSSRGFWVVEGLATMMEEFAYNPQSGVVRHDPLAVDSLDTIANCPDGALLPWDFVLLSSHAQFGNLMEHPEPIPGLHVPMTWQLSASRTPSALNLFYAQAGAICHYFFMSEDGKYRDKFIKFIGSYYADEAKDWTPDADFGGDPKQLGKRVLDYAIKRVKVTAE